MSEEKTKVKEPEKSAFEILFPGKRVEVDTGTAKLIWTVFPVGVEDMQKCSKAVGRALSALGAIQIRPGATWEEHAKHILPAAIPIILEDLLGLVAACCKPDPANIAEIDVMKLPYWHVIPIVEAWIEESFVGEGKLRPLVNALERAVEGMTGKKLELWKTLSKFSSRLDIDSGISSTDVSPDSPTGDGASPS